MMFMPLNLQTLHILKSYQNSATFDMKLFHHYSTQWSLSREPVSEQGHTSRTPFQVF